MRLSNRTVLPCLWLLIAALLALGSPHAARAHFSYSDPRIIHVVEEAGLLAIPMRLPAPLALLPEDWQGSAATRLPPFASARAGNARLDPAALTGAEDVLGRVLTLVIDGRRVAPAVRAFRLYADADRPRFGTLKTAQSAFSVPAATASVSYFDATLDILLVAPGGFDSDILLASDLGARLEMMERFGTVLKLHRAKGTETHAVLGTFKFTSRRPRPGRSGWPRRRLAGLRIYITLQNTWP